MISMQTFRPIVSINRPQALFIHTTITAHIESNCTLILYSPACKPVPCTTFLQQKLIVLSTFTIIACFSLSVFQSLERSSHYFQSIISPSEETARSNSPGGYCHYYTRLESYFPTTFDALSFVILSRSLPNPLSSSFTTGYSPEVIHPPPSGCCFLQLHLLLIVSFCE